MLRPYALAISLVAMSSSVRAQCPGTDDALEPNDTCQTALPMAEGSYPDLYVEQGDSDFYLVDVGPGEFVETTCYSSANSHLFLRMWKSDCTLHPGSATGTSFTQAHGVNTTPNPIQLIVEVYIPVSSPSVCDDYDMEIELHAIPTCSSDAFENNNSCATAKWISPGTYSGLHVRENNWDYYKVDVPAGHRLHFFVDFEHNYGDVDTGLSTNCSQHFGGGASEDDGEFVQWTNNSAQTMTMELTVVLLSGICNDYTLTVDVFPHHCNGEDIFEDNDDCSNYAVGALGTLENLNCTVSDPDHYGYPLGDGETLHVELSHDAAATLNLEVSDGCGAVLLQGQGAGGTTTLAYTNTTGSLQEAVVRVALDPAGSFNCLNYDMRTTTTVGSPYCGPAVVNSSGRSAELNGSGSSLLGDDHLQLTASGMAKNKFGFLLASQSSGSATPPGSQGHLCLSGQIKRYQQQVMNTGYVGTFSLEVDLGAIPSHGAVQPGDTWYFQAWFRDINNESTSNLSDGYQVTFQ